jgi:hypothetical protein
MECLRTFNFGAQKDQTFTGADVKTWTAGAQEFFVVDAGVSSTYTIQGFKNINIYGIDIIGTIMTKPAGVSGCVLEDWAVSVYMDGFAPSAVGSITGTNNWTIVNDDYANLFNMGKYSNSIRFNSPWESVKKVQLLAIKANGYGGQFIGSVNLYWNLNFVFHYKYEGE